MNELLDLLKERSSVRSFKDDKIEQEKIDKILEAAKLAPTACNKQPQKIYVINTKDGLAKLQKCKHQHFNEQAAFLVCYDEDECWEREYDNHKSGEVDASIVTTYMMLEAESLGLSSTWIMHFIPEAVITEFELEKNIIPVALLVVGYKVDDYKPSQAHNTRKDVNEFCKKI